MGPAVEQRRDFRCCEARCSNCRITQTPALDVSVVPAIRRATFAAAIRCLATGRRSEQRGCLLTVDRPRLDARIRSAHEKVKT